MSIQTPAPRSGNLRSTIGWVGTALWVGLLVVFLFHFGAEKIKELKPNEWGDTLAGWFAPLALFWIVLGYLQQGDELPPVH